MIPGNMPTRVMPALDTASTRTGKVSPINGAMPVINAGIIVLIACPMPPMTVDILGTRLPIAPPLPSGVISVFIKSLDNFSKFEFSSAIPVSKFCHAAFMLPVAPSIVPLASFAVVPVMFMRS